MKIMCVKYADKDVNMKARNMKYDLRSNEHYLRSSENKAWKKKKKNLGL